jgi:hypothetical protein
MSWSTVDHKPILKLGQDTEDIPLWLYLIILMQVQVANLLTQDDSERTQPHYDISPK